MLNYQTNAYHDASAIREILKLKPIEEFHAWLEKMGITRDGKLTELAGKPELIFGKRGNAYD